LEVKPPTERKGKSGRPRVGYNKQRTVKVRNDKCREE